MKYILIARLELLFSLTTDIAYSVDESLYSNDIVPANSKTFGEQLWSIIMFRENVLLDLFGSEKFTKTELLNNTSNKFQIMKTLHESSESILKYARENPTDDATGEMLFQILEHEAQKHGLLMGYMYGHNWDYPQSWNSHNAM